MAQQTVKQMQAGQLGDISVMIQKLPKEFHVLQLYLLYLSTSQHKIYSSLIENFLCALPKALQHLLIQSLTFSLVLLLVFCFHSIHNL